MHRMRGFKLNVEGNPKTIADRLIYLRRKIKMSVDGVAKRFNVDKSTMSRWEATSYWDNIGESTSKREQLLKLAELYQTDFYWVLNGKNFDSTKSTNILIVDDDNTSSSIISMLIISIFGGKFTEVNFTNGKDALNWTKNNSAAAVICDYKMPELSGDLLIRELRNNPNYASTPIYAITVHDEPEIIQSLKDAGSTHVLVKPVNDHEIFNLLNSI